MKPDKQAWLWILGFLFLSLTVGMFLFSEAIVLITSYAFFRYLFVFAAAAVFFGGAAYLALRPFVKRQTLLRWIHLIWSATQKRTRSRAKS